MNTVAIGVGSNIEPFENIKKAKELISSDHSLIKSSKFVKTKPIGYSNQNDFINGVFLVETNLSKSGLTYYLKEIENKLGRIRTHNKYGPRTIDLDILIWNGKIVDLDCYEIDFLKKSLNELGYEL